MRVQRRMSRRLVIFLASGAYIGRIPVIPATAASAIVCAAALWIARPVWVAGVFVVSAPLALVLAYPAVDAFGSKDPREFVLDEVAGMSLALLCLPLTVPIVLTAFIVFRFLDIRKPLGIRSLDAMRHPTGIVWDDLLAGLYARLILEVVSRVMPS